MTTKSENFVVISLGSGYYDLCETDSEYTLEQIKNEIHEYNYRSLSPKWVTGVFDTRKAAEQAIDILQKL